LRNENLSPLRRDNFHQSFVFVEALDIGFPYFSRSNALILIISSRTISRYNNKFKSSSRKDL